MGICPFGSCGWVVHCCDSSVLPWCSLVLGILFQSKKKICHQRPLTPCQLKDDLAEKLVSLLLQNIAKDVWSLLLSTFRQNIFKELRAFSLLIQSPIVCCVYSSQSWLHMLMCSQTAVLLYHLPTETVCKWLTLPLSASVVFCSVNKQPWGQNQLAKMTLSLILVSQVHMSCDEFLKSFNNKSKTCVRIFINEAPSNLHLLLLTSKQPFEK